MQTLRDRLAWYGRRLQRMSPPEIVHRVAEQTKRAADAQASPNWGRFGHFGGPLCALPGLRLSDAGPALRVEAAAVVAAARAGRLSFLHQPWPDLGPNWWEGEAWLLDPVSGQSWRGHSYRHAPGFGDVKFVWELNRLQILQSFAIAALDDPAARDDGLAILAGWMAANPVGACVNWKGGIEYASRLASIAVLLSAPGPALSASQDLALRQAIDAHACAIARYPSLYSSANNHRVAELGGLIIAASIAPGHPKAARWLQPSLAALEAECLAQIHPDGVGAEQSPTYTAYTLEWLTLAAVIAEAKGQPVGARMRARLSAALDHFVWAMDEGGKIASIGDDDGGRVLGGGLAPEADYTNAVASFTARFLSRPWAAAGQRLRDLLGAAAPVSEPPSPPEGRRTFADGGYTVWRIPTSDGTAVLTFDHGPLGYLAIAAHGHADALSIWLHWGEEPVLADAGAYLYHAGGSIRDQLRGTRAHNTLCLSGGDQSDIAGPFNWSRHAKAGVRKATPDAIEAAHDGYKARFGLTHVRRITVEDGGVVLIEDRLEGEGGAGREPLPWRVGFLCAPGVRVVLQGESAELTTPKGRRLFLRSAFGAFTLEDAEASAGFNQIQPTKRLVLEGATRAEADPVATVRIEGLEMGG